MALHENDWWALLVHVADTIVSFFKQLFGIS
jgi:hypothetical protein